MNLRKSYLATLFIILEAGTAGAYVISPSKRRSATRFGASTIESKGFGNAVQTKTKDVSKMSMAAVKTKLIDLLPRMTGQDSEYRAVEQYVNRLEELYQPAQTLDFLNLAMQGEWQLLFSTNLSGTPNPMKFRLRELIQTVDCRGLEGSIVNKALWDLAEDADASFDATGTFTIKCSYNINQGARMIVDLEDHILEPARGSTIPNDVQGLVGLLHRSMPKELFDPSGHAIDTTFMDADVRIVRYTGARFEGCRDVWIRTSAFQLDPVRKED